MTRLATAASRFREWVLPRELTWDWLRDRGNSRLIRTSFIWLILVPVAAKLLVPLGGIHYLPIPMLAVSPAEFQPLVDHARMEIHATGLQLKELTDRLQGLAAGSSLVSQDLQQIQTALRGIRTRLGAIAKP